MATKRIGRQTVTVIQVDTDRFGDRVETTRVDVPGCLVQPRSQAENLKGQDQARDEFIVYGPAPLAAVTAETILEVPGIVVGSSDPTARLEAGGNAAVWVGTNGKVDHIEVIATRTTG